MYKHGLQPGRTITTCAGCGMTAYVNQVKTERIDNGYRVPIIKYFCDECLSLIQQAKENTMYNDNTEFCGCAHPGCTDCGSYAADTWDEYHAGFSFFADGEEQSPNDCQCDKCLTAYASEESMVCTACFAPHHPKWNFCEKCGEQLRPYIDFSDIEFANITITNEQHEALVARVAQREC